MKIYNEHGKLTGLACNSCGRVILMEREIWKEDFISIQKEWGYFSQKDGIRQTFDLCEKCCDKLLEGFQIPAETEEMTELV